ncbi:hypothetical protein AAY473_004441 [Plecturocebus cupreus]
MAWAKSLRTWRPRARSEMTQGVRNVAPIGQAAAAERVTDLAIVPRVKRPRLPQPAYQAAQPLEERWGRWATNHPPPHHGAWSLPHITVGLEGRLGGGTGRGWRDPDSSDVNAMLGQ